MSRGEEMSKARKTTVKKPGKGKLSGTAGTGDILCPFFCAHGKKQLKCKDIYPNTTSIVSNFTSEKERMIHEDIYCEANYKQCWLYKWAMEMIWDDD